MVTPFSGITFHENFHICAKLERMYIVCRYYYYYYTCIIFLNLVERMCKLYNLEIALKFRTFLLNSLANNFFFLSTYLIFTSRRDMLIDISYRYLVNDHVYLLVMCVVKIMFENQ